MNVRFTTQQKKYIDSLVKSGDYQNASEAVRDAIRLHQLYREKLVKELKAEIEKGWDGAASPRKIKDIVKARTT